MNRFTHFIIALAAGAALLTGCETTSSTAQSPEQISTQLRKGRTTKSDVRAMLGEPDKRSLDPSGEVWTYGSGGARSDGEAVVNSAIGIGAGFIPYAGTALGALRTIDTVSSEQDVQATIKFDERGVVRDYQVDLSD